VIEGPFSPSGLVALGALIVLTVLLAILAISSTLNDRAKRQLDRHWFLIARGFSVSVTVDLDVATFRNGLDDYIRRAWAYKPPDLAMPRWFPDTDRHMVEIFDVPPGYPTDKTRAVIELSVSPEDGNQIIINVRCLSPSAASFALELVLSLPLVLRPADEWMAAKKTQAPEAGNGGLAGLEELKPGPPGLDRWRVTPVNGEIINRRKRVAELRKLNWTYEDIAKELTVSVETVRDDLQALGLTKRRNRRR